MINMISIIVPVYNVKEYLSECVDSIKNQSLKDIEIVLVDDGSTDGSSELCDAYAKTDQRIQVIHQKNGGSTRARNAGLLASHGEYIGFVDSDDWIEPGMYEELLQQSTQHGADIVVCARYCNHHKSEYKESIGISEGIYEKDDPEKRLIKNLIYSEKDGSKGVSQHLYDKLFKKELLCRYQFLVDERIKYGEDDVCVYSCLIHAEKVVMLDKAFYHYRQREGSLCHMEDPMYFEGITWVYQQLREEFVKHSDADILMEQLNRYMLELVFWGVNKRFGFGYGVVVPMYLPPYQLLAEKSIRRIVLYGAGNVGQDYFRSMKMGSSIEVLVWVDKQYEDCQRAGLPVDDISRMDTVSYDAILIAVNNVGLAEQIRLELIARGIDEEKIVYGKPGKMLQDVGRIK